MARSVLFSVAANGLVVQLLFVSANGGTLRLPGAEEVLGKGDVESACQALQNHEQCMMFGRECEWSTHHYRCVHVDMLAGACVV